MMKISPSSISSPNRVEQGADGSGNRAEVERDRHGLRHRLTCWSKERGGKVHSIAHDSRVGGAEDRCCHLVRRRRQGVRHDLSGHRVGVVFGGVLLRHSLHDHRPGSVESYPPFGRDHDCRVVLIDEERPGTPIRGEVEAIDNSYIEPPGPKAEKRRSGGARRPGEGTGFHCDFGRRRLRAQDSEPYCPDLDRCVGALADAVDLLVRVLEGSSDLLHGLGGHPDVRHVDLDIPVLSPIPDVRRRGPFGRFAWDVASENRPELLIQRDERVDGLARRIPGVDLAESDVVILRPGMQQPQCREDAGVRRYDNGAYAELRGQAGRVNRTSAAQTPQE